MGLCSSAAVLFASCLLCAQLGLDEPAQEAHSSRSSSVQSALSPSQIFSNTSPAVVVIVLSSRNDEEHALGSGFIVGPKRIVTNHHVMAGMNRAFVLFADGQSVPVSEVIGDSPEQDLIILGADTGSRGSLILGDEMILREGDSVYAIGAPKGLELSFTNGIVSSFRKSNSQFLIQTTAPIAPGSSGGPLLDSAGRVVGVTTYRITDAPGIYFSVGIGDVKRLLRTPYAQTLPLGEWWEQQAEAPGEQSEPSLESTLDWMSDFSTRFGKYNFRNEHHENSFQKAGACEGRVTHNITTFSTLTRQSDYFKLGDIDPAHVIASRAQDSKTVTFFTRNNYPAIHRTQTLSQTGIREFNLQSDFLSFDSTESAKRFAAALKHAVTLCSGSKEPF